MIMRKFVVHSHKGKLSVFEVEIETLSAVEDSSIMFLHPGEYKARMLKPELFHQRLEKIVNGKKEFIMVPEVWYSFAFYDSKEDAFAACASLIRKDFEFKSRKCRCEFSEDEVTTSISDIEFIPL